jgi:hypothetical protein
MGQRVVHDCVHRRHNICVTDSHSVVVGVGNPRHCLLAVVAVLSISRSSHSFVVGVGNPRHCLLAVLALLSISRLVAACAGFGAAVYVSEVEMHVVQREPQCNP